MLWISATFLRLMAVCSLLVLVPVASGWCAQGAGTILCAAADQSGKDIPATPGHARLAVEALGAGEYEHVITLVDQALDAAPANATLYVVRGRARVMMGDVSQAVVDFSWALRLDPENFEACLHRGMALRDAGRVVAALADFDRAESLLPTLPDRALAASVYFERGTAFGAAGEHVLAAADFSEALQLYPEDHPNRAMARLLRGLARKSLGRYQDALADFDEAVRLDGGFFGAHRARGRVLMALGRDADALHSLDAALSGAPKDVSTMRLRAAARLRTGDLDGALEDAASALASGPDDEALHLLRAQVLVRKQQWAGAVAEYSGLLARAGQNAPGNALLLKSRAYALERSGDAPGAARDLRAALALRDDGEVRSRLALLLLLDGKAAEAHEIAGHAPSATIVHARALAAMNRTAEGAQLLLRAISAADEAHRPGAVLQHVRYLRRTDPAAAHRVLREALETAADRDRAELMLELGLCLRSLYQEEQGARVLARIGETGATGEARDLASAALALDQSWSKGLDRLDALEKGRGLVFTRDAFPAAEAAYLRGQALLRGGDVDGAARSFGAAIRLAPEFVDAWAQLGRAHITGKDFGRGIDALNQALAIRPGYALALAQRARANVTAGRFEAALADYDVLLDQVPDDTGVGVRRAEALASLGRVDEARSALERILEQHPGHDRAGSVLRGLHVGNSTEAHSSGGARRRP